MYNNNGMLADYLKGIIEKINRHAYTHYKPTHKRQGHFHHIYNPLAPRERLSLHYQQYLTILSEFLRQNPRLKPTMIPLENS